MWLMAMAVIVCLMLILSIIGLIVVRGSATFWPGPIDEVRLADGSLFLGEPTTSEVYRPQPDEWEAIEAARSDGAVFIENAFTDDGTPVRRRYFVGNRDLGQESFRWVPLWKVVSIDRADDVLHVERQEWGPFLGRLQGIETLPDSTVDADTEVSSTHMPAADGSTIQLAMQDMEARRTAITRIDRIEIPRLQNRLRELEWRIKGKQLAQDRSHDAGSDPLSKWVWWASLIGMLTCGVGFLTLRRSNAHDGIGRAFASLVCLLFACGFLAFVWIERPGGHGAISAEAVARVEAEVDTERTAILATQADLLHRLDALRLIDNQYRIRLVEPSQSRLSPSSRSMPDDPMRVSQIVRIVRANDLGWGGRIGVYLSRWWEFLSTSPREGAAAGGVYPVIVGTVTLTMLLTVSVVPLGVIAALYLREYAKQGIVTSVVRIAINNLAGVPSIVYGMFGLGFFCYTLGGFIDAGPTEPVSMESWWGLVAVLLVMILMAGSLGMIAQRSGDRIGGRLDRTLRLASGVGWLLTVVMAFWVVSSTPYFHGFFEAKLPEQTTFGGRGILWASLTLALLTLPVVIVATEEAIAAVPGSMREGSFGCGASNWQTIRKIVLPSAMPGILTGAILAMARGAGEVAPLMLVGAVNLAPALPVSMDAPFLHGDRTFMHLGFHIYTLGFQSPDSEATAPLVWTTTLLLITIVLALNLIAIIVRARLRARMKTSAV